QKNFVVTGYFITGDTVSRNTIEDETGFFDSKSIAYAGLGSLELDTGTIPHFMEVLSTSVPTTINAGTGNIRIAVGGPEGAPNLDNLQGALTINGNGTDELTFYDQANPNATTYALTGSTLTRAGMAPVSFSNISNLVLNGGSGADTFNVLDTANFGNRSTDIHTGTGGSSVYVSKTTGS